MTLQILSVLDFTGTIAFALSGALTAINGRMDLFGINFLAMTTACGGGIIRDIIIGRNPPAMFRNPFYVATALITANALIVLMFLHRKFPEWVSEVYEHILFWFDTLGLAAFTIDGVMLGVASGFGGNMFLMTFLGFITGTGGGVLSDVLAARVPGIFRKHIYALASIIGSLTASLLLRVSEFAAVISGFCVVVAVRILAAHFRWNLPAVK